MDNIASSLPYCGQPPSVETLFLRWNLDPLLISALLLIGGLYAAGAQRDRGHAMRDLYFYSGWALTSLALISPLCALSVSLFSARVGQHMLLALAAAPLVSMGRPVSVIAGLVVPRQRAMAADSALKTPLLAAAAFMIAVWVWHAPAPYAHTFKSTLVYWTMHLTTYAAAVWLWTAILNARGPLAPRALLAGVASVMQMGFLGAAITFATRPLYEPHILTTYEWGLTRLADQQLGGAIMWAPGCAVFMVAAVATLHMLLRDGDGRATQAVATAGHL